MNYFVYDKDGSKLPINILSVSPSGKYFVGDHWIKSRMLKSKLNCYRVIRTDGDEAECEILGSGTDYAAWEFAAPLKEIIWEEENGRAVAVFHNYDYGNPKWFDQHSSIPFDKELFQQFKIRRKNQKNRRKNSMSKIRIGIAGYGNLGKGVELAIRQNDDMELAGIFTRRDPSTVKPLTEGAKVFRLDDAKNMTDAIDVMIICGGSATDLPEQTPELAKYFNVIDSFDTHARIPEHFANVDKAAKESGNLAFISLGWDPGLFSLNRLYAESILPSGKTYTFWGKGVSQGHSDAIRRVEGVKKGIQYTVPVEAAMEAVRSGSQPELTTRQKHLRECWVVAEEGADKAKIEESIKTMKNYFDEYDTTVNFISEEEFNAVHNKMPHGGFVMRSGVTGDGEKTHQMIEYSLKLESNPEFTASVLICFARALDRMKKEGATGCKTAFDVPPAYLSPLSGEELRAHLL